MKVPLGFSFSGIHSGIKPQRKDVALVYSDTPCSAAGCFTANKARAAPVQDAEGRLPASDIQAVIVNSGNANALTGPAGLEAVRAVREELGRTLSVPASAVLAASTGVIGHPLPVPKVLAVLGSLKDSLRPEPDAAAEAIMTTDTRPKQAWRSVSIGGRDVIVSAIFKGSGMMHPSLATVIAVITTDCAILPGPLAAALREAVSTTFNSLTVDGDMSPNDTVYALANGRAGNAAITDPGPELRLLTATLADLCLEMAREIASDGEGATKLLEVEVTGAPSVAIAQDLARAVAGSTLVKAAVFGADPNWGRVLATVGARAGTQGYAIDPYPARVCIQGIPVYEGTPRPYDPVQLKTRMREPEVRVEVHLTAGTASSVAWGCDLSYDYVKINADYTSLIVPRPDGGVGKDDRLANYSPAFKTTLLVEALSYISRFRGKRCVIRYGGAAMVKESLKQAFCRDIELLRSAGLQPIIVHGGGPELTRTLDKLGLRQEGALITDASGLKVVEMVISGSVNSELVTLLNNMGDRAVGLSGKDGALLRARRIPGDDGRSKEHVGEVTRVNHEFLEMLLGQGYVPVISPMGLGEDGQTYDLGSDAVASEIASALKAHKLIYLHDAAGILKGQELFNELTSAELEGHLAAGAFSGSMRTRAMMTLKALSGGVERVHVIDGRVPHSLIAELFTDKGVGTLVTR
ncbi:bifunctional glutamate N-acetyltransferase/amino-acid acetyltransferase ArgJ [Vitiosangium sp. GDMCC 1.1324]|uniref:bifunctional glutamate N-acetyltransferase/amino-acid acetyltransferase ArgJ n=1 Tax=Vitiosangium sp. (strain GDMCC 1.1324) TaxID=2138576 RepID=UPI000D3BEE9E|nr:bifunctional glutamate N-acetyltransferase/amino-acid acetyltransferase ArgJ [Vitiosangium sp. GDMCC 1.1324]PTL85551.1 arginine biosynthesis protein ArgJ [Vitiosangium sp. GDMCC 1.1324]